MIDGTHRSADPPRYRVSAVLAAATTELAAAGVESARADAEWLLAYVLGVDRGRLVIADDLDAPTLVRYQDLLAQRGRRVPLQYLVGTAAFGPIEVAVGPGVFIPRPETEFLLDWAVRQLADSAAPLVADLCSGSGALALSIARSLPTAQVIAVENDPVALTWLRRNVLDHALVDRVRILAADVTDYAQFADHAVRGSFDVVVTNPPYVPADGEVSVEVAADPAAAVFAGADGMSVITAMVGVIATLLRPGGTVGIEHDDTAAAAVIEVLTRSGDFAEIAAHNDLTGRPRFVTARRR
ncbi:MAG: peptide chain release factor N(5)-glutamine methyltransferase [Gordonia sp. (in: high G+C Gram-positive bacteria)]